jgi:hypothetical protein
MKALPLTGKIIPYVAYGYIAVLIIPLIYLWHSSLVWAMKKADIRAEKTGALTASDFNMSGALDISLFGTKKDPKVIYFALPDCCAACCYYMV